jgi:hypothetical protein
MRAWRPALVDLVKLAGCRIRQWIPAPWCVAEIGVMDGNTAAYLLSRFPNCFVYMIDPWKVITEYHATLGNREQAKWKQREYDRMYERSLQVTDFAKERRQVLRCCSLDIVHTISDSSLHLAFLDGDKRKEVLALELLAWWPKIKPGGILCGHDWGNEPDVKPTVTAWAEAHKLQLNLAPKRSRVWWVDKEV